MLQPVTLAGQLHCALVAKRLIKAGQELFFDYGIPATKDHPWLNSDVKKIGITIDKRTEIMHVYHSFCVPVLLAAKLNPSSDIVDWQKFLATDIDIQLKFSLNSICDILFLYVREVL